MTGQVVGTLRYLSPERLNGQHTAAGDVYSLGATLYVALTARVPFPEKANREKLEAHRTKQPRNVCELRPEIPAEVGAIVARMMEKDPAKRFQSAAELIVALKPHAKRRNVPFDFRELVTLRARQARTRAENTGRRLAGPKSSITSASGWLQASGHHFSAAATDSFGREETPSFRHNTPEHVRSDSVRSSATAPIRPVSNKGPAPAGWKLQIAGQKKRAALVRTRNSIGSGSRADLQLIEPGVDDIQCWIEFDGQKWQLRQESKSHPTYVNGRVEAYCTLRHGSRLSFGSRTGFRLIYLPQEQQPRRRQIKAIVALFIVIAIATVCYAGWRAFFR